MNAVYYPEMDKFKDFVHFYKTYDELKMQIKKLLMNNTPIYTENKAKIFLKTNTWNIRAKSVYNILENVNE